MKSKLFTLLAFLLFSAAMFAQEAKIIYLMKEGKVRHKMLVSRIDSIVFYYDPTYDKGVIINGIKWATRNVDAPGTFITKPEDAGMFYQWNRNIGWSATDPLINSDGGTTWNSSTPAGTTWEKRNDPSPAGWRVPTFDEIKSLFDKTKVDSEWTTQSGVSGRKFTDKTNGNTLFLPAARCRWIDGKLEGTAYIGEYWTSTQYDNSSAYYMQAGPTASIGWYYEPRHYGLSVRCIADGFVIVTNISLDKATHTLDVGGYYTLTANVMPVDATDKIATWTSSDKAIATVDNNGKITAVAAGTATITAKAGDKTATCTVTVTNNNPIEKGVIINGVRWATRNVDAVGTFAPTPESPGMFYQWNCKKAWPATGDVTGWDSNVPEGDSWKKANDPSPAGWRVPTLGEIESLLDDENVDVMWTIQNGVNGYKFTDKTNKNSLFLPAVGYRYRDGDLMKVGESGCYWSGTQYGQNGYEEYAYELGFVSYGAGRFYGHRNDGDPIRCVAE